MIASSSEIKYFLEVYRTQHISKSAIRLGITQPTLTVSLQKLEEKLGVKLFHRSKQGVVPTPQGDSFFQNANLLVEYWSQVRHGLNSSMNEIHGRFKIGCHPSVGAYTLPTFFKNLQKDAPKIDIELFHDFSRKITEKIVSFEIDLGFLVNPSKHPDLVLKKMGVDRVLLWKNSQGEPISKLIFADMTQIQLEDFLGKTHLNQFKGWTLVSSSSLELIRTMTLSGQGIGILPERVAKADGAKLVPFDKNLPVLQDQIFLAYRKDALISKAAKELIKAASFELQ